MHLRYIRALAVSTRPAPPPVSPETTEDAETTEGGWVGAEDGSAEDARVRVVTNPTTWRLGTAESSVVCGTAAREPS